MPPHCKPSQNDRRLKKLNSEARRKTNQIGKKELEEAEKNEKQMRL